MIEQPISTSLKSGIFFTDRSVICQKSKLPTILEIRNDTELHESYFFQFYNNIISKFDSYPFKPTPENRTLPSFRTYTHPTWKNWTTIWTTPAIVLSPRMLSDPMIEPFFNSTLFRLCLPSDYISAMHPGLTIHQSSTITFAGYEDPDFRHIVEWCQCIYRHEAYLKVVGIDSSGQRFPYSDPDYPSFILVVPACIAYVPSPSSSVLFNDYLLFDTGVVNGQGSFSNTCWLCGHQIC
jgi:hypothetical protein